MQIWALLFCESTEPGAVLFITLKALYYRKYGEAGGAGADDDLAGLRTAGEQASDLGKGHFWNTADL